MTDSQIKYQNVMESRRHNLEMERLGTEEAAIKRENLALTAESNRIADYNAKTARKKQNVEAVTSAINNGLNIYGTLMSVSPFMQTTKTVSSAASGILGGLGKALFA